MIKNSGYLYNTYDRTTSLAYTFKYVTVHIQNEKEIQFESIYSAVENGDSTQKVF